jgi:hypothetical protein
VSDASSLSVAVDVATLQTLVKKQNDIAMAQFTMAFTTHSDLAMIYEAESIAWPNGKASSVVDALFKKYAPQDTASLVELQDDLNNVKMKNTDDPSILFGKLLAIKNKYNSAA